jgi:hypothetical protein
MSNAEKLLDCFKNLERELLLFSEGVVSLAVPISFIPALRILERYIKTCIENIEKKTCTEIDHANNLLDAKELLLHIRDFNKKTFGVSIDKLLELKYK